VIDLRLKRVESEWNLKILASKLCIITVLPVETAFIFVRVHYIYTVDRLVEQGIMIGVCNTYFDMYVEELDISVTGTGCIFKTINTRCTSGLLSVFENGI
jgi:hypothetical protein